MQLAPRPLSFAPPVGPVGVVEVICGPMFSGKTEELIRRLRRARIARRRVAIFKPRIDDRYDEVDLVSHDEQRIASTPVDHTTDIRTALGTERLPEVVGVDEAQFFGLDLVPLVEELADRGVRVVVAGLDLDYLGRPFGPIPHLLSVADTVSKQLAVCMVCGAQAARSQRVRQNSGEVAEAGAILVGAFDAYEARCRRCFVRGVDLPAHPAPRRGGEG